MSAAKIGMLVIALAIVALVFFAALSSDLQALTTSRTVAHPVIARKILSIGAFALAGFAASLLLRRRNLILKAAFAIALLSAVIEIAQRMLGSDETLRWNLIDIACGGIGGAVGSTIYLFVTGASSSRA